MFISFFVQIAEKQATQEIKSSEPKQRDSGRSSFISFFVQIAEKQATQEIKSSEPKQRDSGRSSFSCCSKLANRGDLLVLCRSEELFTVLVNTWKRPDLLKKSVQHYSQCPNVHSIRVVWSESREPPSVPLLTALQASVKKASQKFSYTVKLKIDMHQEDNLNTRFRPLDDLGTRAIFSVDDAVLVPCDTLRFAFTIWSSAHDSMVGFVPRMHWLHGKGSKRPKYTYGGWWSVWWTGTYSMVLSNCALFHKKYLDLYTNHMSAQIRDYVTWKRNCEDIAMSFLVANITKAPPIWVKGSMPFGSLAHSFLQSRGSMPTGSLVRGLRATPSDDNIFRTQLVAAVTMFSKVM
ncbi:hypothetical protein L7F22_035197 [Adiantum nelumboides]|nr:hypothetical protein [Adiantum nelumboides]